MITCCLNCTSRHQACHDTCEKYKARSGFSEVNLEVNEDERMERNGKEPSDKERCWQK